MTRTPLHDTLEAAGAVFGEREGAQVALHFGAAADEYRAAATRPTVTDRSHAGRIRIGGEMRQDYLQRVSSGPMKPLGPGAGAATVLPTPKGRYIAYVEILDFGDHYLALTAPTRREAAEKYIRKFRFGDDVKPEDVTASTVQIEVFGPGAAGVVESALGASVAELTLHHHVEAKVGGASVVIVRGELPEGGGYHLIAPAEAGAKLWEAVTGAGDVNLAGAEAYEWLRVKAGLPAADHEQTEETIPLETDQLGAIDFQKGCYTGQEVIAKLYNYNAIPRRLRGLRFREAGVRLGPEHVIRDGKRDVGRVTTVADLPDVPTSVGLALVRSDQAKAGTEVVVADGARELAATVVDLPFTL